ncbi:threonine synthase [Robiginitalea biformata]|uniref:Threonine synthase n=1 Tax=Robiginitalea biformata (strain ATCC BAA-864 / DSM 15991 / KCTC 12146 / HTCC2501) TaxID=313596 RepID=A4CK35_ROBBH|nr:threonine synthase [Robiginitalea biformata]EAR15234.1 threonine synthase [Robiginitalea biformata HTCC2501]
MRYHSLNLNAAEVPFREAVIQGIAPDKGLYFPVEIPRLPDSFWKNLREKPINEIALELMRPFVGDSIPDPDLGRILEETLSFEFPLVELSEGVYSLELYHGPTLAFKDVGSRFMARCLGHFSKDSPAEITVLVATSGDTGGAVADGFLGVPGVEVVILYPEGKVSDIQERQLTTLGQNIRALRVSGSFDDCQRMVKRAFLDNDLKAARQLTSANSINVARWIPQMLYYAMAWRQLGPDSKPPVFAVPSGNFGNICAGMLAHRMGMPCRQFVAATNVNDTVPRFMESGQYAPEKAVPTISNAMDVADPSNFVRIRKLFGYRFPDLDAVMTSHAYTDGQTRDAMRHLHETYGYIADPHGAVGYLGLSDYLLQDPGGPGIFLETAHPIKFRPEVERTLGLELDLPERLRGLLERDKTALPITSYDDLRRFLMQPPGS